MERSVAHGSGRSEVSALCAVAPRLLAVDGVAMSLIAARVMVDVVAASSSEAHDLERLLAGHGEGPAITAASDRSSIAIDDLDRPDVRARWPRFTVAARARGVRSVASLPLVVGDSCLGALTMHRREGAPFDATTIADAERMAELVAPLIAEQVPELPDPVVHQAEGMISVQLRSGIADAAAFLRARAFTRDLTVEHLAREIVSRHVRLDASALRRASDHDETNPFG